MRLDSPTFLTEALAPNREPRYVVSIDWTGGDVDYFASHSDVVNKPAGTYDGYFSNYASRSATFDPETGTSEIGSLTVELVDLSENVTSLFQTQLAANKGLRGKEVRLYKGFADLDWSDYVLVTTQRVVEVTEQRGKYSIRCADLQRSLREDIFEPKTTALAATVDAAETTSISVDDTSAFELVAHGTSYSHGPSASWGYIQIDDEIIGYQSKTATQFNTLERGLFNTDVVAHEVNPADPPEKRKKVSEFIYLELPAPKLAYALMTGVLHNQGGATLPDHWQLGIDTSLINLTEFTGIGSDLWDPSDDTLGLILRFEGLEKIDGKRFLESEVFQLAQIFAPVRADGKLGLRRYSPVISRAAFQVVLTEDNVASLSPLRHKMRDVINQVIINWGKTRGEFRRRTQLIDLDSVTIHGKAPVKTYSFAGLAASRATQATINQRFDAIRDRYAAPPQEISLPVFRSLDRLEVGDAVRLQLTNVRDLAASSQIPLARTFESRRKGEQMRGPITLDLFGSSQVAQPTSPTGDATALPDGFYTAAGTALSTIVTITSDVTATGTYQLTGAADADSGIYYHDGDLTIADGTVLEISDNVQLRVRGFLQNNGEIRGIGGGIAGVADSGVAVQESGTAGYFGSTAGGDGVWGILPSAFRTNPPQVPTVQGEHSSVPLYTLTVDGSTLRGYPTDLRGTSGGPGGRLITGTSKALSVLVANGATGGDGGAGLIIICRGMAYGANGGIDLSGGDGADPTLEVDWYFGWDAYPGGGAGGAPGALLVLLDGDVTLPDVLAGFTANGGETPVLGNPLPQPITGDVDNSLTEPVTGYPDPSRRISGDDYAEAAHRVIYIPAVETPVEEEPETVSPPSNTAVSGETGGNRVTWTEPAGIWDLVEIHASADDDWANASLVAAIRGTEYFHPLANGTLRYYWTRSRYGTRTSLRDPDSDTSTLSATAQGGADGATALGLIVNGNFETGNTVGWTFTSGAAVTTSAKRTGSYGARIPAAVGGPNILSDRFAVTAGDIVKAEAWVARDESSLPDADVRLAVRWYDSAGSQIGTSTIGTAAFGTSGWQQLAGEVTAISGAVEGSVDVGEAGGTTGHWFADDVKASFKGDTGDTGATGPEGPSGPEGPTGPEGPEGDSVTIIYRRSKTRPTTPSPSASTPANWYADVNSVPAGADPIWASPGTKASGATNYTWQTPVKLEATVAGELIADPLILDQDAWDLTDTGASWSATGGVGSLPAIQLEQQSAAQSELFVDYTDLDELPVYRDRKVLRISILAKGVDLDTAGDFTCWPQLAIRDGAGNTLDSSYFDNRSGNLVVPAAQNGRWFEYSVTIRLIEEDLTGYPLFDGTEPTPWRIQVGLICPTNANTPAILIDRISAVYEPDVFEGGDASFSKIGAVPPVGAAPSGKVLSDSGAWQSPAGLIGFKTGDQSVVSSTTMQDDNHIAGISLEANALYAIEGYLSLTTPTTADFKMQLVFSQTPQEFRWSGLALGGNLDDDDEGTGNLFFLQSDHTSGGSLQVRGFVYTNAADGGTVKLQWAQLSSVASQTTLGKGSYLKFQRLS